MESVEEKRWSKGQWSFHVRPGTDQDADLTVYFDDKVLMEVSGSAEFCRSMIRAINYNPPSKGHFRYKVIQMHPDFD